MKIYIVKMHDYDGYDSVGYFTEYKKAESCCEYLNRTRPSEYSEFRWYVKEYNFDETDYESLNKELDEQERLEFESRLERERQAELAELARCDMKRQELKITKKMLYDGRYQGNSIYGIKKSYCDLHDCCEVCNSKVRFLCKIIQKIEDLQIKIINKIIRD